MSRRLSLRARFAMCFAGAALPFVVGLLLADSSADSQHVRRVVVISLVVGLVLGAVVAARLALATIRPVHQAVAVLQQAAGGNFRRRLAGSKRVDEYGEMARALNAMLDNAADALFAVGVGVQTLSSTSKKLRDTAGRLSSTAENASDQSTLVSYAADQVSVSVVSAATGSEQMETAIRTSPTMQRAPPASRPRLPQQRTGRTARLPSLAKVQPRSARSSR